MAKRVYERPVNGRRISIHLPETLINYAALVGKSNTSRGIREILEEHARRAGVINDDDEVFPDNADDPDFGADPVPSPEPKPSTLPKTTPTAADVVRAQPDQQCAVSIFDIPLTPPKPIVYDDDEFEEMSLEDMLTPEERETLIKTEKLPDPEPSKDWRPLTEADCANAIWTKGKS